MGSATHFPFSIFHLLLKRISQMANEKWKMENGKWAALRGALPGCAPKNYFASRTSPVGPKKYWLSSASDGLLTVRTSTKRPKRFFNLAAVSSARS